MSKTRVKHWMIKCFLTFDSMDRTLKCKHSLKSCRAVIYCGAVCFLNFTQFGLGTVSEVKGAKTGETNIAVVFQFYILQSENKMIYRAEHQHMKNTGLVEIS